MSILDDYDSLSEKTDIAVLKKAFQQKDRNIIVRTIHPVGQGAFYTERAVDKEGNTIHLMVYDCGSISYRKLKREVSSSLSEDKDIDLLFISHFDRDHVNGLKYLKNNRTIKKVVMPLISSSDKWFYLFVLPSDLQAILLDPQNFFGKDTTIIYVRNMEEDNIGSADIQNSDNDIVNLESLSSSTIISSGTQLQFLNNSWCYIPFNYGEERRKTTLTIELQKRGIDVSSLANGNLTYIDENRKTIKEAYQNVCPDGANKCSLILYSGAIENSGISKWWNGNIWNKYFDDISLKTACLYVGDTDLNQQVGNQDILDNLSYHLGKYHQSIGTIQLPHHGSIKNFNKKILTMWNIPKHYFASYGENNPHGHPSSSVLGIVMRGNSFFGVTENRSSIAIELIYLLSNTSVKIYRSIG